MILKRRKKIENKKQKVKNKNLKNKIVKQKVQKKVKKTTVLKTKKKKILTSKKTKRVLKKREKTENKDFKEIFLIKPILNPILKPRVEYDWENWQTFNPGVIFLDKKIHFLYRAIGRDGISRLGYANSLNGFYLNERLNYPVYEHKKNNFNYFYYSFFSGGSFGGVEDPRLVKIKDEDRIYMTYTACDNGLRVGLTSIKVNDFLNKNWKWQEPKLISKPNEVHKNWVIFPEKINNYYAILTSLNPKILISYRKTLEFKEGEYIESYYDSTYRNNKNCWDYLIRGAGSPPIKTKYGWLLFYQAMSFNELDKYKVGAMLLDLKNPEEILIKSNQPILVPDKDYENNGYKKGVVYVTGAVKKDDYLLVYYGSADSYVSVAYNLFDEFLEKLVSGKIIELKVKGLKTKK